MLKKTKNFAKNNLMQIKNFGYLSFLQVFSIALPLLTYPYLIRVLGKEMYGLIVFAQSISFMFSILIEFGYNITATKQVSIHRDNHSKISEIVSSVLLIKFFLGLISFVLMLVLVFTIPSFGEHKYIFLLSLGICINEVLFPQWFFQGIEKMKYITIISVLTRVVFVFCIFIFIKTSEDYLYVPLFNTLGALLSGVISLYVVFGLNKISFFLPKKESIVFYFKDSLPIFWSKVISKIKDQSNTLLIGATIGMTEVAYYDLASKIVNIVNSFIETITITVFPKLSHTKSVIQTRLFFNIIVLLSVISYLSLVVFGEYIVLLLGGDNMEHALTLLPIVGLFLLRSICFYIGNSVLIINNKMKPYVRSLYLSGFSYFVLIGVILILDVKFTIELFVWVSLISLLLEFLYRVYACKKNNLLDNLIKINNGNK